MTLPRRKFMSAALAGLAAPALATPALVSQASAATKFELADPYKAQLVRVKPGLQPGTIHVEVERHFLYFIMEGNQAMRYGVAVGAEGRNLRGSVTVGRKVEWPSWTPTANMIRREPENTARSPGA